MQLMSSVRNAMTPIVARFRLAVFGVNNEKLDFLVDSFYKLSPDQRMLAIIGGASSIFLMFLLTLLMYFVQVESLESELDQAFEANYEFQNLKSAYDKQNRDFERLLSSVSKKVGQGRYKPFFEKTAADIGARIDGLSQSPLAMDPGNALGEKFTYVNIDMSASKISLPRLLNYLIEVEKSNNYLSVDTLSVRARFNDRLYFDSKIRVRGYGPASGG